MPKGKIMEFQSSSHGCKFSFPIYELCDLRSFTLCMCNFSSVQLGEGGLRHRVVAEAKK